MSSERMHIIYVSHFIYKHSPHLKPYEVLYDGSHILAPPAHFRSQREAIELDIPIG
jgi:hypothetical protein